MRWKVSDWLGALPLLCCACIGQSVWCRWESVRADPGLAPIHRVRVITMIGDAAKWRSVALWRDAQSSRDVPFAWKPNREPASLTESDEYHRALVETLAHRGIVADESNEKVDVTLVVEAWLHRAGSRGISLAGVDLLIERASNGERMFSGTFIGPPAAAADAIADLMAHGHVDET